MKQIYYYIATAIVIIAGIVLAIYSSNLFALGFALGSLVLLASCFSLQKKYDKANEYGRKQESMRIRAFYEIIYLQAKYKKHIATDDNLDNVEYKMRIPNDAKQYGVNPSLSIAKLCKKLGAGIFSLRDETGLDKSVYN